MCMPVCTCIYVYILYTISICIHILIYIYIYMCVYPPPCLWHQVRVHRVLSAPAGSDPAGLGGNPASLPNSGAASA